VQTLRMILLGALVRSATACADVSTCPERQGATVVQDGPCATVVGAHETAASPRTTKQLLAFLAGERSDDSVFAYTITHTMRTRLERTPSVQLIADCLAQYGRVLQAPSNPSVQEAALTTRTWRNHPGTIYQAVELLLETQAPNRFGRTVRHLLSCPLNEDDALDTPSMDAYLTHLHRGCSSTSKSGRRAGDIASSLQALRYLQATSCAIEHRITCV
jgi:hypothetical protein